MRLRFWSGIAAVLVVATWFAWGASIVVPTTGGAGGSATNAQPPSTVLSNITASGLSLPYIALSTNGGSVNSVTSLVARSGIVVSNDSAGIASLHVTAGSGSQTPWAQDINGAGYNLTDVASLQINGTGASILSIASYQGDRFALTRATNSPAATGTTNDIQVAQGASAGQVLGIHANSIGQIVWTNLTASAGLSFLGDWYANNVVSNVVGGTFTTNKMSIGGGGGINSGAANPQARLMPYGGSIRGIVVNSSGAFSAGSIAFEVFTNDVSTGVTVPLSTTPFTNVTSNVSFQAGTALDLRYYGSTNLTPTATYEVSGLIVIQATP